MAPIKHSYLFDTFSWYTHLEDIFSKSPYLTGIYSVLHKREVDKTAFKICTALPLDKLTFITLSLEISIHLWDHMNHTYDILFVFLPHFKRVKILYRTITITSATTPSPLPPPPSHSLFSLQPSNMHCSSK